jgi:hypothetical protein
MSISDYLKYKRVTNEVKNLNEYPSVLSASDYTDFKEFEIERKLAYVNNTKGYMSQVNDNGSIFGMSLKTSGCTAFPLCKQTHTRVNRIPMATIYSDPTPVQTYQKVYPQPKYTSNCDPATKNTLNSVIIESGALCNIFTNERYSNSNPLNKKQMYANMQASVIFLR